LIQTPGPYISQQASELDVNLVRTAAPARRRADGSLTVEFSATAGASSGGVPDGSGSEGHGFTAVDESVTFAPGQTTQTVAVPIDSRTQNPGLLPIVFAVTPPPGSGAGSRSTVYLVRGPQFIPPAIIGVRVVKRGITITFSKPMATTTVENVHNYAVEHRPSQDLSVADLTGVGLIQRLNNTASRVVLRRAVYDPTTSTVTLIPKDSWPSSGTYEISSPSSLGSRRSGPHKAQPLADGQGNLLNPGGNPVPGAFSISIRRGHPFTASAPVVSDGRRSS
jgi:hypothetical protein